MYNHTHQGVFTIRGDMCYDNKLMANTSLPGRPPPESIALSVAEHDRTSAIPVKRKRIRLRLPILTDAVIVVIVLIALPLLEFGVIPQTKIGFYCEDPTISFPFYGDTISIGLMLVVSIVGPLFVISAVELYRENSFNKSCGSRIWKWYRECLMGFTYVLTLTEVGKIIIGEHRPHFLHTCAPNTANSCTPGAFVSEYACTNERDSNYFIMDSSRSFPSGHASVAVYVSLFCACLIHQRIPKRNTGRLLRPFLTLLCAVWASTCSLTRIIDKRHHWWDVLAGSVLGVAVALYTIIAFCKNFQVPFKSKSPKPLSSTTALLDIKNKDATSVII